MNVMIMKRGVIKTLSSVLKVVCGHDDGDSSSKVTPRNLEVIAETCVKNEYIRHGDQDIEDLGETKKKYSGKGTRRLRQPIDMRRRRSGLWRGHEADR